MKCPKCGSTEVSGLMEAFWVMLDQDDQPEGQWQDWEGCTEIGDKRMCTECEHEFEAE